MDSVPDSTVRAVARKLRHYIDVERREDGFDRSGPMDPLGEFTSTRGGTLYYNSLQDKHLQHYFRKPIVRKRLEELGVSRRRQQSKSLESGIQNLTGVPAQASGRCRNLRLVNTTAKLLTETGSTLSAYTPKNHCRKLSAHGSYSSFASEIPPDQQSLTSKSGHSVPSQTARRRSTRPSDQVSLIPTSPPGSSHTPAGKREPPSAQQYPPSAQQYPPGTQQYPPSAQQYPPSAQQYPPSTQQYPPSAQQYPQGCLPSCSLTYPPSSPSILELRQANVLHSHSDSFVPTGLQVSAHRSRRCVRVVSVGVSTATSCDASTQTLVHAETQTEKSMLAEVRFGKDKRSKRRTETLGSKVDREVVLSASHQESIVLKATTQMKSEGSSTEPQRQRVESVDETTSQGDTADRLQVEPYNETTSKGSSVELQRQRVGSQDEKAPGEGSAEQLRVGLHDDTALEGDSSELQRQRVGSQNERAPEEGHLRVESHDDTTLEGDSSELQRQGVGPRDERAPEESSVEHLRVESHGETTSKGNSAEPQRQRVGSQDGTASEEEPQRQRVGSQDGTASEEEPQRQRVGSQNGTASEEEPQRQRVGSQDGTASEVSSEAENEVIQETASDREAAVHMYIHEAVDSGDRLKELISHEGGSHSATGLLTPEQDDGGDEHLEDKWTSDTEQGTRGQSAEKQRQQQEQEVSEVQEEMRRDSSTFLDLAREEEEENKALGSSHENDTDSV